MVRRNAAICMMGYNLCVNCCKLRKFISNVYLNRYVKERNASLLESIHFVINCIDIPGLISTKCVHRCRTYLPSVINYM